MSAEIQQNSTIPKVSVIVPTYNVELYIGKCLDSILNQTYQDFEVIVVNDGSKDSTGEIADKYARENECIRVIHKENGGLPQARKTGFEASRGAYIVFIDSDDWIETDMLESLKTIQEKFNSDMTVCGIFWDNGPKRKTVKCKHKGIYQFTREEAIYGVHARRDIRQYSINKMYKRELFNNVVFPSKHTIGEDYILLMQLLRNSNIIVQTDKPLYHYEQRFSSMCNSGFNASYAAAHSYYEKIKEEMIVDYPKAKSKIIGYHAYEGLGLLVAMFRNDCYDTDIVKSVICDVKENFMTILMNHDLPLMVRGSAVGVCINYKLVRVVYRKYFKFRTRKINI